MTAMRAMLVACGLGVTLLLTPLGARAAEPSSADLQAARDLFAKAEHDEEAKNWSAALEKLRRAVAIKTTAGLRFHIATCEENLGQLVEALHDFEAAEDLAKADKTEKGKQMLTALADPLLAIRARVPHLKVTLPTDAADASVAVDGKPLSTDETGTTLALAPGTHRIEATAAGRAPFAATLILKEHESSSLEITLPTLPPPAARSASGGGDALGAVTMPPAEARKTRSRTGATVVTGGAVVLAAGGLGAFLLASGAQSDGRDACARTGACDSGRATVRAWDTIALGAWIAAAAATGYAIVLWSKPSHDERATTRARLRVGAASVDFEGAF